MADRNLNSHSAEVDIYIDCGEFGRIPLSQASSTFVIAESAVKVPPCDAEIVIIIDGRQYERKVKLIHGMDPRSREAMVLSRDSVSPF